uniref:Uncharacterized protein n=1 Tax=viral metagenome TaxID=1070528 RepID=A0A6C0H4Y3_9ZZZZ
MVIVQCPHCFDYIEIIEIKCGIFRHGIHKKLGLQIPPHSNKIFCDYLYNNNLIYGCGKPFIIHSNKTEICDYI